VFNGGFTSNGDTVTFASANADDPLVIIKNTANDTTGPRLQFTKDKGAAGANNDVAGVIDFVADDAVQTQTTFGRIISTIRDSANTSEGGNIFFQVASHDGELSNGLVIKDGSAEDEVDVNIGTGTSSLTTVAGDLAVTTNVELLQGRHIRFKSGAGGTIRGSISAESNDNLQFSTGSSETARMTINTDGKVLIGSATSGRASVFQIHTPSENGGDSILLTRNDNSNTDMQVGAINFGNAVDSDLGIIAVKTVGDADTGSILLSTATDGTTAERMRVGGGTAAQQVYIGKTGTAFGTAGVEVGTSGLWVTRAGGTISLNRLEASSTVDGAIIEMYAGSSAVGSIGSNGGDVFVINSGGVGAGLKYNSGFPNILPCNGAGADRDNAIDLGHSGVRFDDIYATNGTIQTSDRNEKQDIAILTSAEMLVAKRISALFKTFRWKDKVASKGDNARTHSGIIAQDVQSAFSAEGLDAGDYSLFTSGSWWEQDVDVAAVEAADAVDAVYREVTKSNGDVINELVTPAKEAVEAVDAYTRTDTYKIEDEAPSGSTKKTRLGIRYPELLSFLAAYNEQRFASIETRLTALET